MPARSKSQQRLMGMAYACKKSGFEKCASEKVMKIAQSMKEKDLIDFASTKTKNLPERKKPMHFKEWLEKSK